MIGVNGNNNAKKLKDVMDKENLNWRSFADRGAINTRWNAGTPTYYVIDGEGVIRYKWVGSPGEKAIDTALEKLIKEAERNGGRSESEDKPVTPADQYRALLKEFQLASSGGALSDEERMKFVGRVYKLRNDLALKFVDLAERNPKDPVAVDALIQAVWQVNTTPWPVELVGKDTAGARALALLLRDHIRSDKLGSVCQRISFGFCKEYEPFLRTVLERSPHREIRSLACLGLAHFLSNRLQRLNLVKEQPELATEFEGLFGREYLKELRQRDRTQGSKEAEVVFEQAVREFGDVKIPGGGTVGEKAKAELFEIRQLSVGKEAPDIEGQDQDGNPFKLSDYRGRVVLLDFWHQH